MKSTILFFFIAIPFFSFSQFHLSAFGGVANYQGDLQPKRFTFHDSHLALGLGAEYEVTHKIWIRAQFTAGSIRATDKSYTIHQPRNLSFATDIKELQLVGQFLFRNLDDYRFTPYLFGGIALFHFNPYTTDTSGHKYFLKPLSTEGEGFIAGKKTYNLTQLSLPIGGGIKINMSPHFILGVEMGFRKTFTDYLDDVSGTYVDQNLLLQNRGAKAVELAYRGGELKNGAPYPSAGAIRGGSGNKDMYYFGGASLTYKFGSGRIAGGSKDVKGQGCPANSVL